METYFTIYGSSLDAQRSGSLPVCPILLTLPDQEPTGFSHVLLAEQDEKLHRANPESKYHLYRPHSHTSVLDTHRAGDPSKTRRLSIIASSSPAFPSRSSQARSPDARREPVLMEPEPHPGPREADTRDTIDRV